jgi:hypothetical protein
MRTTEGLYFPHLFNSIKRKDLCDWARSVAGLVWGLLWVPVVVFGGSLGVLSMQTCGPTANVQVCKRP